MAVSKLVAGREKDLAFVQGLFQHHLANPDRVGALLDTLPIAEDIRALTRARLNRLRSRSP